MTRTVRYPKRLALLSSLLLGSLTAPAFSAPQGFVGPLEPGLRWIHGADLSDPWIPSAVAFAARGELVWVGTQAMSRRLMLFGAPGHGVVQPVYGDPSATLASNILSVEAGPQGDQLFALRHLPEPDLFNRRTVVSRHSAFQPAGGSNFDAEWTVSFPFVANGPSLMAVDGVGDTLIVAAFESSQGSTHLRLLATDSGATLMWQNLVGNSLESLAISADGSRIAVGLGRRLVVLDDSGVLLHDEQLDFPVNQLALDGDGSRLVLGMLRALRVYDETAGSGYGLTRLLSLGANEVASKVAVSDDGVTYAAATWRSSAAEQLRYEVYAGDSHQLVNQVVQNGIAGGLQNAPVGVDMTADGARIVFASWGMGDSAPEMVLLQRGQPQPILEADLPGSAMGVCIDEDGLQVAVVTKNLHANQVGSTGEVRLYATGETSLELLAPARLGLDLKVQSREPGSSVALFLVGKRSNNPVQLPGTVGSLQLLRNNRLRILARPTQAQGLAELALPIPAHNALLGVQLSVQTANRVNGQYVLSERVLDPLFY